MKKYKGQLNNSPEDNINWSELDMRIQDSLEYGKRNKRVYHYTSLDVFFKILSNVKDGVFTFWAGSVYTMNDKQEMCLGYENIERYLPLVEKELQISPNDMLYNMSNDESENEKIRLNFGDWMINNDITNFVVSFSNKSDILPMWALYGGKGKGVCLEFSPFVIEEYYKKVLTKTYCNIGDCVYKEEDIKKRLIEELKVVYKCFMNETPERRKEPLTKAQYLATMCGVVGAFVKHPGFEYEQESRMVVMKSKEEWKYNESYYRNLRIFAEVPIPINALTSVIVGPAAIMDDVRNPMLMAMRSKGIYIEPKQSGIPFRLY